MNMGMLTSIRGLQITLIGSVRKFQTMDTLSLVQQMSNKCTLPMEKLVI